MKNPPSADREIVISRELDAPRELVFAAFTDHHRLARWWGPRGFTITTQSADIREGGSWVFTMHGPDGTDYPNRLRYTRIIPNERIEMLHDSGADDPHVFDAYITFEPLGGKQGGSKTKVTLRNVFGTAEQRAFAVGFGAIELGMQTLEKLGEHVAKTTFTEVPGKPEMKIRRIFDAPRDLVWLAMTRPEHFVKWWGPHDSKVIECEIDLRVGGGWRAVVESHGQRVSFHGEYREIVAPERIVQTFVFDPVPTEHSVETMTLTQIGDQTLMEVTAVHTSMENIEAMKASGMESGARQTYDRLEDHLALLHKPLELSRTFDAPASLVWRAWTEPAMFARWFSPRIFGIEDVAIEPRVGGAIRFTHVHGEHRVRIAGLFLEVDPERRLVWEMAFVDERGVPSPPPGGLTEWTTGNKIQIVATFRETDGKTTIAVTQTVLGPKYAWIPEHLRNAGIGWKETLERLRELLAGP